MKRILFTAALAAMTIPAFAADVGVSVSVGQPGFYGHIDIGNFPQPQVIYSRPVIIQPVPVGVLVPEPVYLRVPPGHAKNWRKHCRKYNACGQPVYFVQDRWYNEEYVPRYREQEGDHDHNGDEHHGKEKDKKHGKEKDKKHGKGHKDD